MNTGVHIKKLVEPLQFGIQGKTSPEFEKFLDNDIEVMITIKNHPIGLIF
tara:strand:+ start:181 stop:330 length:150 start_codon:yes stop_codon:yes gene_type:complete